MSLLKSLKILFLPWSGKQIALIRHWITKPIIAHEYLEPINDPVYVSDFIKRAKNYNMVYVADTDFQLSAITWMKQERRKLINTMSGGDWNTK